MRLITLCLLSLLLLTGCGGSGGGAGGGGAGATASAFKGQYDARLADRAQFGRLVIAHVNLGKPSRAYIAEHEAKVDARIAERLRKAGYELQPGSQFEEAWRNGVRKWGEPYNPTTGRLNIEVLQYVLAEAVTWLKTNTQVQGVVFTNLEEQQVYFSATGNHTAYFLGVARKPSSRGGDGVPAGFNWIQGVDAVSISVSVLDLELKSLFNGAGGIEVTETLDLKGSEPRWMRSKKILANEDFIDEGISLALRPWINED